MTENVTVLIYGKNDCPYCERAKSLAAEVQKRNKINLTIDYHNFIEEG